MAEVLKLPQLVQHHTVAEVQVRARWVESQFGAQRFAGLPCSLIWRAFRFDEQFVATAFHDVELLLGGTDYIMMDRMAVGAFGHRL